MSLQGQIHAIEEEDDLLGVISVTTNAEQLTNVRTGFVTMHTWPRILGSIGLSELSSRIWDSFRTTHLIATMVPDHTHIASLFVNENHRLKGIGRLLVSFAAEIATLTATSLTVDTEKTNDTAQTFYESLGFQPVAWTNRNVIFAYNKVANS